MLRADGWVAFRAPASLGVADVIALRAGDRPRLIEVKATSTRSPWNDFGPAQRNALYDAAQKAGADAYLLWWPTRRPPQWIPWTDWPL